MFKTRCTLIAAALAATLSAQAAEQLETIVVTGDRFGSSPEQQLAIVEIVDRDDIETLQPKNVVDLLTLLPGVSVNRNGGAGQLATVFVRGASSTQTLVLVDGIRVSSATNGQADFSTLAPEQIERIEVVKGPRASVWGSDAIGGVIQIFTRKLDPQQSTTSVEIGSNGFVRGTFAVGFAHGEGSTTASINAERSNGFDVSTTPDDDGYDRVNVSLNGEQQLTETLSLNWLGQLNTGEQEIDGFSGDETDVDNYIWRLGGQYQTSNWTSRLELSQNRDYSLTTGGFSPSLFETRRKQVSFSNQWLATDTLTFIAGIDGYQESVNSSTQFANNRTGEPVDERDVVGFYTLARAELDDWLLEGAVRHDDVESVGEETTYNASASYNLTPNWRATASIGSGFRAPNFNELYFPFTDFGGGFTFEGNPDLVAETSVNQEIAVHYQNEFSQAYIAVFDNSIDDLILNTATSTENISEAEIKGVEVGVEFDWLGLTHQLGHTYLDAIDKNTGAKLPTRSEHESDYSLLKDWGKWSMRVDYHYQGTRTRSFGGDVSPYHQLDFGLGYIPNDNLRIQLKLNNLLDEEIITSNSFNGPNTEWFLSVSYSVL